MLAYIILLVLGATALLFAIVGLTRHDLAMIRADRIIKKHPFARKIRARPTVYMLMQHTDEEEIQRKVAGSHYKKLTPITDTSELDDAYILRLTSTARLLPNTVVEAVKRLAVGGRHTTALIPSIPIGTNTLGLFRTYATLARLPFESARAGFGITAANSLTHEAKQSTNPAFNIAAYALKCINTGLFAYGCYVAAVLQQPEIVLIYAAGLLFWLVWSILRYPYYSFGSKVKLITLAPTSFIYFIYLTVATPFTSLLQQASPRNVTMST